MTRKKVVSAKLRFFLLIVISMNIKLLFTSLACKLNTV